MLAVIHNKGSHHKKNGKRGHVRCNQSLKIEMSSLLGGARATSWCGASASSRLVSPLHQQPNQTIRNYRSKKVNRKGWNNVNFLYWHLTDFCCVLVVQQIEEENQELLQELNAMTMTTELIDRGWDVVQLRYNKRNTQINLCCSEDVSNLFRQQLDNKTEKLAIVT